MPLEQYRRKRRFSRTPEPEGKSRPRQKSGSRFVVQKHAARRLHYDFRLELEGVLKSWAVPKGPSLDPAAKRLAVHVEDHPLEYADFEGAIPADEYGAGTVIVWDQGTWTPSGSEPPGESYRKGSLRFQLYGERLRGEWALVRMKPRQGETADNWLLIKHRDAEARPLSQFDVLEEHPASVVSGRTLDQVAADPGRTWGSKGPAHGKSPARPVAKGPKGKRSTPERRRLKISAAKLPGTAAAELPDLIQPQLARPASHVPDGDQWLHEIKYDGYRLVCYLNDGRAILRTRNRLDWSKRFPELMHSLNQLPARQAVLDGELVALLPSGASSFQELQNSLSEGQTGKLVYYAFDLLYLDGYDLRRVPLWRRKQALAEIVRACGQSRIQYSEHLEGSGPEFFRQCCRMGLEGIVSKRRDRPYRGGRSEEWLKAKCVQREEFVVGGFTDSTASRKGLGAILVGYFNPQGQLVYAGKAGSGFSEQTLLELRSRLEALEQDHCPFAGKPEPTPDRRTHWVWPELVAQIEFGNWTREGLLRHPTFQGLREDVPAAQVVRENAAGESPDRPAAQIRKQPASGDSASDADLDASLRKELARVRLTHPDRVLYAAQGVTKLGLASYYVEIADWILPHVVDRPLSLVRCPQGQGKACFYQQHAAAGTPDTIRRVPILEMQKLEVSLAIDDLAGLVSLVQMGVLEIHPWGALTDNIERPDRIVFDLDPDPAVAWPAVVAAARELHGRLADLSLASFVKTTGGKGLHVVVPVQRRHVWAEVKQFSKAVAEAMAKDAPSRYTANMAKAARRGRIYVDYLRNDRGSTAVSAYSTRARSGAPVSVPLAWEELSAAIRSDHFHVGNLPGRLASLRHDPWEELFSVRQSLTAKVRKKLGV